VGCSKSTICQLERGFNAEMTAEHTKACADALGCTMGYLLYGEATPPGRMAYEEQPLVKLPLDVLQVARDYQACPPTIRTAARELLKLGAGRI
jgi:transcriptional regulator with XRE-family HTH domain